MAGKKEKKDRAEPRPSEGVAAHPITLTNARLIDPASGLDAPGGLLIADGRIADLGPHLRRNAATGTEVMDCAGHVVMPGLIDMMVFTGEPGEEHRETLRTASVAAAAGGVTTMVCLPNIDQHLDDVALVDFILRRARDTAIVHVLPMAALTRGMAGAEMAEIGLLQQAGAVAFSDGLNSIANPRVMARVLGYARDFDGLVVHHVEDRELAGSGVMHSGEVASRLGLSGIPTFAELIMLERDLRLVEMTGGRYHAAQISCAASVEAMCAARKRGLNVTCGVSINHLTLNEIDVGAYRTFFKLRPPLRPEDDRRALVAALNDGDIDVIVSSHNPQDDDGKRRPFEEANVGAVGLETLLAAALRLHHNGEADLMAVLRAMTSRPAELLGLDAGRLEIGRPADLIEVDFDVPFVLDIEQLHSRSKNTPFEGARLQGKVLRSFVDGREVCPAPISR